MLITKNECFKFIITFSLLVLNLHFTYAKIRNKLNISTEANLLIDLSQSSVKTNQFLNNGLTPSNNENVESLKEAAICYANNKDPIISVNYICRYINKTGDLSILNDHLFSKIKNEREYVNLKEKYKPSFNLVAVFYLFTGILGLLLGGIIVLEKHSNKVNALLLGTIVIIQSIFVLHLLLYVINCQYYFPSSLFSSTIFSFLFAPLLYFYLKRTKYNYRFRWFDILHLLPTILLIIYLYPFCLLSNLEKFNIIFSQNNYSIPESHILGFIKTVIIFIYAFPIIRIYRVSDVVSQKNTMVIPNHYWRNNLILFYVIYAGTNIIYAMNTDEMINNFWLLHFQIVVMVLLIFYICYTYYKCPKLFIDELKYETPIKTKFKYKKSGMTPSYSMELKESLLNLLKGDKMYKENNISLDVLSEKLGTTRHNLSQVINENFEINFSELINEYRISEAMEIMKNDRFNNLNIIQVAYEVGFNNKVTFNKAFKKHLSQTPSQYIKSLKI